MATNVVIVPNLGNEFDIGAVEANKIHVKLGTGLSRAADGTVTVDMAALVTHALSLAGATLNSDVNSVVGSVDLTPAVKAAETLTSWAYDPATNIVTYTDEAGTAGTHDLSALTTDIYVNGGSFDAASMVLTLTDTDGGTGDITVDLSALKQVSTADSATVAFSGTGEAGSPLTASASVSGATAGNLLTAVADGLAVDPAGVTALATVDVQDAFGVHQFFAFP